MNQRDHKPGESVGVFATLPPEVSNQFPNKDEDSSPPHITVCYIGDIPLQFENKVEEVTKKVAAMFRPFKVKLGPPKEFINHKNQTIIHSPVKSKKLKELNRALRLFFLQSLIPVDNKHPEYKPHVTIEYVNEDSEPIYDVVPQGEWIIDHLWVWGGTEPKLIILGKQ